MSTVWPVDQQLSQRIHMQVYREPNGKQFYLPQTPTFGRVELIDYGNQTYLLAVEIPPGETLLFDATLSDDLRKDLDSRHLIPIGVYGDDPAVLLEEIVRGRLPDTDEGPTSPFGIGPCSSIIDAAPEPIELIGSRRRRLAEKLHLVWNSRRPGDPIPCLFGVDGIGKQTIAVAAAARSGRNVVGILPLASLLFDGMIELGHEKLIQAIAQLRTLPAEAVLIVTDAHLLSFRDQILCNEVLLRQLSRLSCQVVLSASDEIPPTLLTIGLACQGLEKDSAGDSVSEAQRLALEFFKDTDLHLDDELTRMLVGYASHRQVTSGETQVIPGRLLFLLRYTKEMAELRASEQTVAPIHTNVRVGDRQILISPDDLVDIAQIAKNAWQSQIETSTNLDPDISDFDPEGDIEF